MTVGIAEQLGLPPIDQVGFVVRDMERALEVYGPMFGPFGVVEIPITGADYRGRKTDCRIKVALSRSGPLEVELIELLEGDALYAEFLDAGREGPHHVKMTVTDLDDAIAKCALVGVVPVFSADLAPMPVRFAYLEAPDGAIVELVEQGVFA